MRVVARSQRARRFCFCFCRFRAWARGGRGGGRLPEPVAAAFEAPRPDVFSASFRARRARRRFVRVAFRASRMIRNPIAMITSTPPQNSPNTPSVLTCSSFGFEFVGVGVVGVAGSGGAEGAGWIGANGLPPPGGGAAPWPSAAGAPSARTTKATTMAGRARKTVCY